MNTECHSQGVKLLVGTKSTSSSLVDAEVCAPQTTDHSEFWPLGSLLEMLMGALTKVVVSHSHWLKSAVSNLVSIKPVSHISQQKLNINYGFKGGLVDIAVWWLVLSSKAPIILDALECVIEGFNTLPPNNTCSLKGSMGMEQMCEVWKLSVLCLSLIHI